MPAEIPSSPAEKKKKNQLKSVIIAAGVHSFCDEEILFPGNPNMPRKGVITAQSHLKLKYFNYHVKRHTFHFN